MLKLGRVYAPEKPSQAALMERFFLVREIIKMIQMLLNTRLCTVKSKRSQLLDQSRPQGAFPWLRKSALGTRLLSET